MTMDCIEKRAGVSNQSSSFVLPLGATINMDGTALYECVAALFIAQAYGLELSMVQQLLVAGNETTTKLLTETIRMLAENPDEWRKLKDDPSRAPAIIEEALRLSTPTQGMFRISTKDHELEGVHIPKGARLVIVFASANRDATLYEDADTFNPDRENLRDHLAFGKGIHFCLGAALSRLEGRVALEELSKRLDSFTLPDSNEFEYFPSFLLRGLTRLDVDVVPAGAST